jgi:hypothetical protein
MTDLDIERDDDDEEPEPEPAPKPKPAKKAAKRPPPLAGVGAAPQQFQRESSEADAVWNELCAYLAENGMGPDAISIAVTRVLPPTPSGGAVTLGQSFNGSAVSGNGVMPPGDALREYITRYYHLRSAVQGPATYDITFSHKTGQYISKGRLNLPSQAECISLMEAAEQAQAEQQGGGAMGMGAPPKFRQQAPAGRGYQEPPAREPPARSWDQPPPGIGYPQMGPDRAMMAELSYLRGSLQEALSAAREGRQPQIQAPPPGVAAPPAPPFNEEAMAQRITANVLMALRQAGIGGVASAPVAAPIATAPAAAAAPPSQATATVGGLAGVVEGMVGKLLETAIKQVGVSMEKSITGVGAPPQEEETDEPETPPTPENPADAIPWTVADVGSSWGNGQPVKVAIDKESGKIDPMGVAFANPALAEALVPMVQGLGKALQDALGRMATPPGAPHVVRHIPQAAVPAGFASAPPPPQIESGPDPSGSIPPPADSSGGWGT